MTERSSNGDYKYDVEEDGGGDGDSNGGDDHQRMPLEKDRSERADKVGEYMKELLAEKLALDSQKCPNALRLLDQGVYFLINYFFLNDRFSNLSSAD